LEISIEMIKELRNQCGAGIMECRNALLEGEGDLEKALQLLKESGLLKAEKKASRATAQGLIEGYIHTVEPQAVCLLQQPYIRDPGRIVRDVIVEVIAKVGENIRVSRFTRFELGVKDEEDG
jgi:elongation factor Ts